MGYIQLLLNVVERFYEYFLASVQVFFAIIGLFAAEYASKGPFYFGKSILIIKIESS